MASKVEIKTLEDLNDMHTGTLMNRRAALLKCEESFEASDLDDHETKPSSKNSGFIEYKNTAEWQQAYKELKNLLSTRGNLPNKQERKEIRRDKARRGRQG